MNQKQLKSALMHLECVYDSSWSQIINLVDSIKNEETIVSSARWADNHKNESPTCYPLDLSDILTWSTFDGQCIDLIFKVSKSKRDRLTCLVKIYDGSSFGGYRTALRFTAELYLPLSYIRNIDNLIEYKLNLKASDAYDSYLESQRKLFIDNYKKYYLKP